MIKHTETTHATIAHANDGHRATLVADAEKVVLRPALGIDGDDDDAPSSMVGQTD